MVKMIDLYQDWIEGRIKEEPDMDVSFSFPDVKAYDIHLEDLDKRVKAMLDIFDNPKSNVRYSRNQGIALANLCHNKKRDDLEQKILGAMP